MKITFPKPKFYALLTSATLALSCVAQLPAALAQLPQDGQTLHPEHKTPSSAPNTGASAGSKESSSAQAVPHSTDNGTTSGAVADPAPANDAHESPAGANSAASSSAGSSSEHVHAEATTDTGKHEDGHAPAEVTPSKTHQKIVLKPGQRIKISGYAEGKEVEIIDPPQNKSQPEYHRVYMRLSGSMCFACLHTFEERLKQVLGVERVKIVKGTQVTVQQFSPDLSNWADATIYYDAQHVNLPDIRAFSKNNGYVSYRVLDKLADTLPAEESNKGPWSKKL